MKPTLLAILLTVAAPICLGAPAKPLTNAPSTSPELAVVVVETMPRRGGVSPDFDLIAEEFQRVFDARHWPVKVIIERFAANNDPHALELKIFYQGVHSEFSGMEKRYRAWTVLTVNGTAHDFGVIEYRYQPRPGEDVDDSIHRIFRGAAKQTADLVEPFIAPPQPAR